MVRGQYRSKSLRKSQVRLPGGSTKTVYSPARPKQMRCKKTGVTLPGIPRLRPHEVRSTAKSKRIPSRPYAGVLSSKATRQKIKSIWR